MVYLERCHAHDSGYADSSGKIPSAHCLAAPVASDKDMRLQTRFAMILHDAAETGVYEAIESWMGTLRPVEREQFMSGRGLPGFQYRINGISAAVTCLNGFMQTRTDARSHGIDMHIGIESDFMGLDTLIKSVGNGHPEKSTLLDRLGYIKTNGFTVDEKVAIIDSVMDAIIRENEKHRIRMGVVADIHGRLGLFKGTLYNMGFIDDDTYWIAGMRTLILTGDIFSSDSPTGHTRRQNVMPWSNNWHRKRHRAAEILSGRLVIMTCIMTSKVVRAMRHGLKYVI